MASTLQKLIRKSPATRMIAALHSQSAQNLAAPCFFLQPFVIDNRLDRRWATNLNSIFASANTETPIPSQFLQFYPSFPFGFCLPQISSIGLVPSEPDYVRQDDSRRLWADSVKKKRKRKMNKHKYKKLRKRLRRQT